jgi:hypothetical protein
LQLAVSFRNGKGGDFPLSVYLYEGMDYVVSLPVLYFTLISEYPSTSGH